VSTWSTITSVAKPKHDALVDALVQLAFATMAILNKVGADHDLSLTQLRVLAILRDRRPRLSALAAYLGLEKSTMTGLVDRAEERGLLARAPNPHDGRAIDVYLTRDGAALADRLYARVQQELASLTGRLGPADRRRAEDVLARMLGPEPADDR
jgi:DNA-binding MarR family transcriptional regulator